MTAAAVLTLVVIVVALVVMMMDLASPDLTLLGGVVVLAAAGVIEPADAFSGFGNTGMLTVAALFIVAVGLRETGADALMAKYLLGRPTTLRGALLRLVAPVMGASSVLNNTAIVATLLPAVNDWSRRIGVKPGRLLMPLSFAAILGGLCTLIGTSTNLVVAGVVHDLLPTTPGLHEIGMFEITPLGVCIALAGGAIMVLLGPWLLPDRERGVGLATDPREFTIELLVPAGSRLAGQTIEQAGLRHLPGAYLMEIVRAGEALAAVDHHVVLQERDRLVFVGDVAAMVDLQRTPGLAAAPDQIFKLAGDRLGRHIIEAVVSPRNPLVGRTIRDGAFRSTYHAVVIAVARAGERLAGRVGDIELNAGDVLLLEADEDFLVNQRGRSDFILVSAVDGAAPPRFHKIPVALVILVTLIVTITTGALSAVTAAFLAAGAMVVTRCCTLVEARRALDLTVLVAIAAAFGLGQAIHVSGLDAVISGVAVSMGADSPFAALVVVYLVTVVLTELITNNAAAVLALPLALSLAERVGAAPMPFVIVVMVAASAGFLTPIGYQTNLMVYNAGGYKPLDFPRLGLPLSIVVATVTLALTPMIWPF